MRASRDWFQDFVKPVWYTIDLSKDKKFAGIDRNVLEKYGHYIRQVLNILTFEHVKTLQHPKLDSIKSMSIVNHTYPYHRALEFDIIRRCSAVLTELEFRCPPPNPDTFEEQQKRSANYFDTDILIPSPTLSSSCVVGSRLASLSLSRVCFTREGFSALLRNSPLLCKLTLVRVVALHHNSAFDLFRTSSVTSLCASFAGVFMPDTADASAPSLLAHFPLLEEWHLTSVDRPKDWKNDAVFRQEISYCCPVLKTFRFDYGHTDKLSDLLINRVRLPESCTFSARNLAMSMVLSLITHHDTLTSITIMDKCTDAATMRWLYLIPKACLRLEVLSIEELVLDMASVEEHEWCCRDLKELRVRFKGLEDAQSVDGCLKSVCFQRRRPSTCFTSMESISSRVSHHLLQFNKLTTVWLGTKVYCLPLPVAQ
ncbi:hypothetical protein BGX29_006908 [Mortierella sp. GBA35]|nr:hypothetical protein BGX29_006908 [Mortierella sp. GBA35]